MGKFRKTILYPIFKATPGVAGLYVSGAFAGTLSTVSSGINSTTTCLVTDIIRCSIIKHGTNPNKNILLWC